MDEWMDATRFRNPGERMQFWPAFRCMGGGDGSRARVRIYMLCTVHGTILMQVSCICIVHIVPHVLFTLNISYLFIYFLSSGGWERI